LRLDYGFTNPLVENLVKEIDEEVVGLPQPIIETTIEFPPDEEEDIYTESDGIPIIKQQKPKRGRPCKPK